MATPEKWVEWVTGTVLTFREAVNSVFTANTPGIGLVPAPLGTPANVLYESGWGALPASGGGSGIINKFRNGTFDIWARGTPINATATYAYMADGWMVQSNGATSAVSRQTGRLLTRFCLRITGAASVTTVNFKQRIESFIAANLTSQQTVFQIWIYNNTGASFTPTLTVKEPTVVDNYGATTTIVNAVSLQACPDATWTRIAYCFAPDTSAPNGLEIEVNIPTGSLDASTKYVQFTEADIRVDSSAVSGLISSPSTPELRPVGIEQEFCERYYFRINSAVNNQPLAMLQAFNTIQGFGKAMDLPTTMRATPTTAMSSINDLSMWNAAGGVQSTCTAGSFEKPSTNSIGTGTGLSVAAAILVAGNASFFVFLGTTSWISASAEL